jgi:hypothetical protein
VKIRNGFVSNSSSSSFVLSKPIKNIEGRELPTKDQLYKVRQLGINGFIIGETDQFIIGYTIMDNLDIKSYFKSLEIPEYLYQINDHIGWVQRDFIEEIINFYDKYREDHKYDEPGY